MRKCDNDKGCPGHIEKFPHCLVEALHQAEPDEDTGSTELGGYYGLYIFSDDEEMHVDDTATVIVPAGTYLIMEDEYGFVYEIDGSPEELRAAFDEADREYEEALDNEAVA